MRRAGLLLLLLLPLLSFAQKKDGSAMPGVIVKARYAYVTSWHGDLYYTRILPEDRDAILRVQSALQRWGRYKLAQRPEDAEIMIVVKPGHLGSVHGGYGVPLGSPQIGVGTPRPSTNDPTRDDTGPLQPGLVIGGEAGSPDDMLLVSIQPTLRPSGANYLWRRSQKNGLAGAKTIPLFETFRKEVEDAAAKLP